MTNVYRGNISFEIIYHVYLAKKIQNFKFIFKGKDQGIPLHK